MHKHPIYLIYYYIVKMSQLSIKRINNEDVNPSWADGPENWPGRMSLAVTRQHHAFDQP